MQSTAPDVYAIIRCEEDTIKTGVFRMDGTPEFNTKAIFYRRRPKAPIYIEVREQACQVCVFGVVRVHLHVNISERCVCVCVWL